MKPFFSLLPKPTINPTSIIEPIIAVFKNGAIAEQTRERLNLINKLSALASL